MSENQTKACTILQLRFKLRVPPSVFLARSREAATTIASLRGLIWKIWVMREEDSQLGGIYAFADRAAEEAYLSHPIIQEMHNHPAVESSDSQIWDVGRSLSALTRAPLPEVHLPHIKPDTLLEGSH